MAAGVAHVPTGQCCPQFVDRPGPARLTLWFQLDHEASWFQTQDAAAAQCRRDHATTLIRCVSVVVGDKIDKLGLMDNTYVIFKSDNGYRRFDTRNFTQPFYVAFPRDRGRPERGV